MSPVGKYKVASKPRCCPHLLLGKENIVQVRLGHNSAHHVKYIGCDLALGICETIEGIIDGLLDDLREEHGFQLLGAQVQEGGQIIVTTFKSASSLTWYCTVTCILTKTLSLVFVSQRTSSCRRIGGV